MRQFLKKRVPAFLLTLVMMVVISLLNIDFGGY